MTLVDTSVWVDYFNGRRTPETDLLDGLLGRELVLLGDLVLAELLQGFHSNKNLLRAREALRLLEFREVVGREVALASARNYRELREKGVTPRKTIDLLIATFCILRGHTLLHSDRDYEPMATHLGLRIARPPRA